MARLTIRLSPRASRDEIVGMREGMLVVRVTAAPVDGAANEALVRLLAKLLDVARSEVTIVSGKTARTKVVEMAGLEEAQVWRRLGIVP